MVQKKNFKNTMACSKCGKTILLKGNRKYCKECSKIAIKEKDKRWKLNNPERTKELKRQDYLRRKDYINKKNKEWYEKKKKELGYYPFKIFEEQKRFGGNRVKALERDNFKCQKCGSTRLICVHHIDGTGRGSKIHNNDLDNLVTLCRNCHIKIHRDLLHKARGIN
jgi:hypothetical protein